ncbi:transglycosylase-like protein with SLT domain [Primorskyibacter sedentarius]|uniref:Transglycosylase-like protein with SLT domain n=1 Tax=Primorskyibacter sedentarius TaxID=745311 RepID=A0A4R3J5E7_9RHOB|nr:transglycosylase-like protein with SLT domain [Primorskyibacter sedentarius]
MTRIPSLLLLMMCLSLPACADLSGPSEQMSFAATPKTQPLYPNETPELRQLINQYADRYDVPRPLVQKVVVRESTHRPWVRNGPNYGLMQIQPATARGMGFSGQNTDLLDAETNLKYAVKYLRGAWLLSNGSYDTAVKWYSRGYYHEAKRQGMLDETGMR